MSLHMLFPLSRMSLHIESIWKILALQQELVYLCITSIYTIPAESRYTMNVCQAIPMQLILCQFLVKNPITKW